jgi:predicted ATPase with chaperone activity
LAIALSVLAAKGQITQESLNPYAFIGELSLDGRIQPVQGALSIALAAASSQMLKKQPWQAVRFSLPVI